MRSMSMPQNQRSLIESVFVDQRISFDPVLGIWECPLILETMTLEGRRVPSADIIQKARSFVASTAGFTRLRFCTSGIRASSTVS